ncbi:PREDICTED: protein FAR1-RELATED SEQUENCE 5-like [Ipomoea nil]|uniref:protein FAR1-RELATED SEQUENCE 5-like n=1 Tax=Ipomoea nil TaxID=35883 RepID=UPI000901AAC5|nr:PREDICTED: protein FAR1-RELATED SEQUENCE 5-like [Ipomoea nil]
MEEGEKRQHCVMDESQNGTNIWVTACDPSIKPAVDQVFSTLEDDFAYYKTYTSVTGFDVCKSSDIKNKYGIILKKKLVCNREGFKDAKPNNPSEQNTTTQTKRRRPSNRVGCMAKIVFRRDSAGRYWPPTIHRDCSKVNIGASKSHDLYAEMVGGVENVGATQQDFKNYRREILVYMQGGDAQMLISKYLDLKSDYDDMYFEYEANENDQLACVFWADGMARKQYSVFRDVVSFDATYKTNRYSLVFVPFTGIDHHKKCVTFAAALIAREDVDSYCWILRNFKNVMGSTPPLTVTDQDPAMKVAIAREFPETSHRYCMWHIMAKVGDKVSPELAKNEAFRRELNDVVWNDSLTTAKFEVAWKGVIQKFGLMENPWLNRMYDERASWIPACFEGVFMGGLKEICAGCFECRVRAVAHGEAGNTYEVEDEHEIRYTVFVENGTRTTTCECRMYNRIGLLCSHAFAVLIYDRNGDIPRNISPPRWTRTALTNSPIKTCNDTLQRGNHTARGNKEESNVLNTLYRCIAMAQGDVTKLEQISNALKEIESTWCTNGEDGGVVDKGKRSIKETFCGAPTPDSITVHPPAVSSTKGSGKRMRTAKESQ